MRRTANPGRLQPGSGPLLNMASRVYQMGTIVSRVNHLLQTGVLKERPLWLDVVEAFPPDVFPKHNQTPEAGRAPLIAYPEDELKRKFYDNYVTVKQPEKCVSLFEEKPEVTSVCSRFVSEQTKRLSLGDDEVEAGRSAMWMLRNEGIDIRVKQVAEGVSGEDGKTGAPSTLRGLKDLLEQMHSRQSHTGSQS